MKNYAVIFTTMILSLIVSASALAAPSNDNFAGAMPIVLSQGSASVTTNNAGATKESGEPNHAGDAGGKSVWFKFTPTATSVIRINTTEMNFDPTLAVYTGSSVDNLQLVGYNNDYNDQSGGADSVDLMLVAGTTYYIAVDGVYGGGGAQQGGFRIIFNDLGAAQNDNINAALNLGSAMSGSVAGTDFGATREAGEPEHYSSALAGEKSVWYRWRPSADTAARIELTEDFGSALAVYTSIAQNPTVGQLNKVIENYDENGFTTARYRVEFFAEANRTYYIAVAAHTHFNVPSDGNFQLKFGKNPMRYSTDFERYNDKSAVAVFRPSDGVWYFRLTLNSYASSIQWGQSGDTPVAADYDGDGATNIAVARNENGVKNWYIRSASGAITGLTWGLANDRAITGDYDGDGRADVGVIRSTANGYAWYIRQSTNGALRSFIFGTTFDKPVFGDFDGDGMTEVAVTRNTQNGLAWYMLKSSTGYQQFSALQFGVTPDVPTPEDYDGDGKTDIAVFRPSNGFWYVLRSSDGSLQSAQFGANGDKPQPADYNGDGKADYALFRPADNTWYIAKPTGVPAQNFTAVQWGAATDILTTSMTTLSQ